MNSEQLFKLLDTNEIFINEFLKDIKEIVSKNYLEQVFSERSKEFFKYPVVITKTQHLGRIIKIDVGFYMRGSINTIFDIIDDNTLKYNITTNTFFIIGYGDYTYITEKNIYILAKSILRNIQIDEILE